MELGFLFAEWLGKPAWMWLAFLSIVTVLLVLDLGVLHREQREIEVKESLLLSAGYIGLEPALPKPRGSYLAPSSRPAGSRVDVRVWRPG